MTVGNTTAADTANYTAAAETAVVEIVAAAVGIVAADIAAAAGILNILQPMTFRSPCASRRRIAV